MENEGVECALDETYEASPATSSESSESLGTAAAATDDCCEVCLLAPREGFALVPCGHAGFCETYALRVADLHSGCPVCRAPIGMVMRAFLPARRYASAGPCDSDVSVCLSVCPSVRPSVTRRYCA